MDVRRDIERGLAFYGRGAVREALEAWRNALVRAPRNEEAQRLVQLVEQRMGNAHPLVPKRRRSTGPGATPSKAVENDLTPVSPLSAWLAPSTHPTELELMAVGEDGAPTKATYEITTRPVMPASPPLARKPQSSASEQTQFQLDQCQRFLNQGDPKSAAAAAELALQAAEAHDDAHAWALIGPRLSLIERAFAMSLGPKTSTPFVVRGVRGFDAGVVDHRTGYLLSCVDGHTDISSLLDICGMPRLEALRALSLFYQRGFLRMR